MSERNGGDAAERGLAPVIPLFGDRRVQNDSVAVPPGDDPRPGADDGSTEDWHTTWTRERRERDAGRAVEREASAPVPLRPGAVHAAADDATASDDPDQARELAEKQLLKKLRVRSLSEREARAVVGEHVGEPHVVDEIVDGFVQLGYLDDAALADQLVYSAIDRKGQGRQAIAQTLAKRGIPRDVADAALPDDDGERALEFARTKARAMSSLDRDTALRRLMGQLARRGYGGSTASNAARQALDEAGASRSGVRFR